MALSRIQNNSYEDTAVHGVRNLIINGAMQVAQRGTSQTAAGYGSIDRMPLSLSGATATMTQETLTLGQTDLPSQFRKFARIATTTGNNNCGLYHRIEDVDTVEGEVTLSFYAKGTNPASGAFEAFFYQAFGTGGSSGVLSTREGFTVTSSWKRFEITFTLASLSGKTIGTNSNLEVNVIQAGADTGTSAWTLDITGVQVELGDTATPFEHRSYGDELARCQRYYTSSFSGETTVGGSHPANYAGQAFSWCDQYGSSPNRVAFNWNWPVQMRTTPTITMYGNQWTPARVSRYNGGSNEYTINYASGSSRNGLGGYYEVAAAATGDFVVAYVEADAEL